MNQRQHQQRRRSNCVVTSCEPLERRRLLASISGTVMQDSNGDGIGDTSTVGMRVWIDLNGDRLLAPTEPIASSDIGGNYSFTGLAAGSYTLYQVMLTGWRQSAPAGSSGITVTLTASQAS